MVSRVYWGTCVVADLENASEMLSALLLGPTRKCEQRSFLKEKQHILAAELA